MTPSLSISIYWLLRNRGLNVGSHVHFCPKNQSLRINISDVQNILNFILPPTMTPNTKLQKKTEVVGNKVKLIRSLVIYNLGMGQTTVGLT